MSNTDSESIGENSPSKKTTSTSKKNGYNKTDSKSTQNNGYKYTQKMIALFFIIIFTHWDMFMDSIIRKWAGAMDGNTPNNKGILIIAIFTVLMFMMIDFLIDHVM